jgi:hypothetical protein
MKHFIILAVSVSENIYFRIKTISYIQDCSIIILDMWLLQVDQRGVVVHISSDQPAVLFEFKVKDKISMGSMEIMPIRY